MLLVELEQQIKPLSHTEKIHLLRFLATEVDREVQEDARDAAVFDERMKEEGERPLDEVLAEEDASDAAQVDARRHEPTYSLAEVMADRERERITA